MRNDILFFASAAALVESVASAVIPRGSGSTIWATPHESYSSSVGVLGCKIDTNRVAYWPGSIDCNNICVEVTEPTSGRSVTLLRIDQSQGAYDMSYDAWNYLTTGQSAMISPSAGGPVEMTYKEVDASKCAEHIKTKGNKLPFSASNSMNFISSCLAQPESWVAKNYIFYNILDPICSWGRDEECTLDWPNANTPTCPHQTGAPEPLTGADVYNVKYPTGEMILASNGQVVTIAADTPSGTGTQRNGFPDNGATSALVLGSMLLSLFKSTSSS